jgi:hypothetical protein
MPARVTITIKGIEFASLGAAATHFSVSPHTISKNRALYPSEPDKWVELGKRNRITMPKVNDRTGRLTFIEEEEPKITKRDNKTHTERRLKVRCDCGKHVSFGLQQWGTTRECKRCATARSARSREIANTASLLGKPLNESSQLIVRARDWKRSGHLMSECTACNRPDLVSIFKVDRSKNQTCGCSLRRHGADNFKFKDLTSKVFADGKVQVLSLIGKAGDDFLWKALCKQGLKGCKGEFEVRGRSLTSDKQSSCGCLGASHLGKSQRRKSPVQLNASIEGSFLIPREPAGKNRHNQLTWKCQCTYGGPGCVGWWIGTTGQLSTRMAKSCGCLNNENLQWGGLRMKRCYDEPEFAALPRFIYLASFDGGAYWKIGITDNLKRRATALYDRYLFSRATTTGVAMAVERCALYRTRWAAPSPIPIQYKMEGGTEIRFQDKIPLQTLQVMVEGFPARAEADGWKELVEGECPLSTYMEPATYTEE